MEQDEHAEAESMSEDKRLLQNECHLDDESLLGKEHVFRKQLHLLAAKDDRVSAFVHAFSQDHQCLPSILDFVPAVDCV